MNRARMGREREREKEANKSVLKAKLECLEIKMRRMKMG